MGWKDLEYKERWKLIVETLQATATVGTFLVAMIGVWKVVPIITYQIERQEAKTEISTEIQHNGVTARFMQNVHDWWTGQVKSYQRIMELIEKSSKEGWKVSFEVADQGGSSIVPEMTPDLLIVRATDAAGKKEVVKVPVNDKAMTLSQYIQCQINQGALSELEAGKREQVEIAVGRYLHSYMLPRVSPAYVEPDMSLQKLHDEIALQQQRREDAIKQIRALSSIMKATMDEE